MNKEIKTKLDNVLKAECEYTMKNESNIKKKAEKMNVLFNIKKILDNYDELEPVLREFFDKKAQEQRFERGE